MARRSLEHKIGGILIFARADRNVHETERQFNERFPEHPISRKYLRELVNKFLETGSVEDRKRTGRRSISEDTQVQILTEVVNANMMSSAAIASTCDVSPTTARKYLKKNKYHPYKIKMLHELTEDDPDRRTEFLMNVLSFWMENCIGKMYVTGVMLIYMNIAKLTLHFPRK
nr:uncharacterized protein LOC111420112 [Onthophagus taurus]